MIDNHSNRDLSRSEIMTMLTALGAKLQSQGLTGNIQIVGGAAIALTLKDTRVTQDVDALVTDHRMEFRQASIEVAHEHGVNPQWISDDISDFIATTPEGRPQEIVLPGVNVIVASSEHLLAMKVRAATERMQDKDREDLVFLADHLGLETPEEIAELTHRQFAGGVYRDHIGYDEYVATARDAFLVRTTSRTASTRCCAGRLLQSRTRPRSKAGMRRPPDRSRAVSSR